ncbi:hypothetical protein TSOC_009491 [Tetrabaena socialis]|uniref:Uncharacterized protein n=1 Tax=Tetrabaena socialis TaxID=47790 RepID=A0A2J7ZVP9_9CHLO|nr:hypothetical protein TSOC_009491 [Tetrabaena socialis]|eukprot:PNH04344.1 hypothetical protein TSOC_009491 [Tetrabaena socialis]
MNALKACSVRPTCSARSPSVKVSAIAAPLASSTKGSTNGGGPHRVLAVQATMEDINKALGECIKQAADMSSLEKINRGIGKEITKAATNRFQS